MKRFSITATQSNRTDVLGIKRLPAHRYFRLLRVIRSVRRGHKWCQNRRSVGAVPFLALSEIHLQTVESWEVPRRTRERYPYFLVDCPDIPVSPEALPVC